MSTIDHDAFTSITCCLDACTHAGIHFPWRSHVLAPLSSTDRRIIIVIQNNNGNAKFSDDVALFIDWENFKISLAVRGRTPNVSALKEEVANHGRVVVGKAYADWVTRSPELRGASQFTLDPPSLYAAGIEPVYVPTRLPTGGSYNSGRTTRVKNSVDVKMTADCIDTAHNFPNINTFVLVSGDSDFIHVINSLRAVGKRVIVVGVSWATSRRMADHVDGLIFYDSDVDPIHAPEPAFRGRQPAQTPLANPGRHQLPEVIRAIEDVIRAERTAGHTLLLTSLKQRLVRRIAGFDERKLGFSGFKKLMLRVAEEGNIKIRSVDLVDWILMANEPDPEPEIADVEATDIVDDIADDDYDSEDFDSDADDEGEAYHRSSSFGDHDRLDDATDDGEFDRDDEEIEQPAYAEAGNATARVNGARQSADSRDADELFASITQAVASLELMAEDGEQTAADRVADLIVMGHTLEERDGADSVMFNAFCNEVSDALANGIEAGDPTVIAHWSDNCSRTHVTRLVRSLTSKDVFQYRNVSFRDESTNRTRRRRVFGLNRTHPLIGMALAHRLGPSYAPADADFAATNDAIATPPLEEHHSAEAARPESAEEAEVVALN